jgi:hypothetical protein
MAEDDFVYPLPVSENFELRFTNALASVQWIYNECGLSTLPYSGGGKKASASSSSGSGAHEAWFTFSDLVIAGGMLKLAQTMSYPSPKGFTTITRARVDDIFDKRYLIEYEDRSELAKFTYLELDMVRFAFVAIMDLASSGKVFNKADGSLTPLAKRDIRKNCIKDERDCESALVCAKSSSASSSAAGAASSSSAVPAAAVQKHVRGILEDECQARWPHTPVTKSCIFTVEKDPAQPKHKPLFQALVEIAPLKKSFKGSWVGNKRDAENSAAEVAIRALHSMKTK